MQRSFSGQPGRNDQTRAEIAPDHAQELDYIQMPPFEAFRDAESYYATLAHEVAHWTKNAKRLDRDLGRKDLWR